MFFSQWNSPFPHDSFHVHFFFQFAFFFFSIIFIILFHFIIKTGQNDFNELSACIPCIHLLSLWIWIHSWSIFWKSMVFSWSLVAPCSIRSTSVFSRTSKTTHSSREPISMNLVLKLLLWPYFIHILVLWIARWKTPTIRSYTQILSVAEESLSLTVKLKATIRFAFPTKVRLFCSCYFIDTLPANLILKFRYGIDAKDYSHLAQVQNLEPIEVQMQWIVDSLAEVDESTEYVHCYWQLLIGYRSLQDRENQIRELSAKIDQNIFIFGIITIVYWCSASLKWI